MSCIIKKPLCSDKNFTAIKEIHTVSTTENKYQASAGTLAINFLI